MAEASAPPSAAEESKQSGTAAFKAGRFDDAVAHFTTAIEADPQSHVLFSNRSAAYAKLEQYKASGPHRRLTHAPLSCLATHDCLAPLVSPPPPLSHRRSLTAALSPPLSHRRSLTAALLAFQASLLDANQCIKLAPTWAKGHSRRGAAYVGLRNWRQAATHHPPSPTPTTTSYHLLPSPTISSHHHLHPPPPPPTNHFAIGRGASLSSPPTTNHHHHPPPTTSPTPLEPHGAPVFEMDSGAQDVAQAGAHAPGYKDGEAHVVTQGSLFDDDLQHGVT